MVFCLVLVPKRVSNLIKGKIVFLATASSSSKPNLVCVEANNVFEDKILITNNMMCKTIKNLKQNKKASIAVFNKKGAFQLIGVVEIFSKGKWFGMVKELPENKSYFPKSAILFSVKEIWDLNKGVKCLL